MLFILVMELPHFLPTLKKKSLKCGLILNGDQNTYLSFLCPRLTLFTYPRDGASVLPSHTEKKNFKCGLILDGDQNTYPSFLCPCLKPR